MKNFLIVENQNLFKIVFSDTVNNSKTILSTIISKFILKKIINVFRSLN